MGVGLKKKAAPKAKVAVKAKVAKKRRLSTFKDMLITRENSYEVANGNGVDYDSYLRVFPDQGDKHQLKYQFYFNSYLSRAPQGYSGCQAEKRYSTACDLISNSRVMTNMNYKDMTMVAIKPDLCPPCPKPKKPLPCKKCKCQKLTDMEIIALHKVTGLVLVNKLRQEFKQTGVKCDLNAKVAVKAKKTETKKAKAGLKIKGGLKGKAGLKVKGGLKGKASLKVKAPKLKVKLGGKAKVAPKAKASLKIKAPKLKVKAGLKAKASLKVKAAPKLKVKAGVKVAPKLKVKAGVKVAPKLKVKAGVKVAKKE